MEQPLAGVHASEYAINYRSQVNLNRFPSRRTGGDHQDALVLRRWRLSSKTWNPITSPWMKQMTLLRIVHSGDWRLRLLLPLVVHARN